MLSYPTSAEGHTRCEVFRDLWEKGHCSGTRYCMGGDSKLGEAGSCIPVRALTYHLLPFHLYAHAYLCAWTGTGPLTPSFTFFLPPRSLPRPPHCVRWRSWCTAGSVCVLNFSPAIPANATWLCLHFVFSGAIL
ncbi:hypothetical protein BC826DRAFT_1060493 [Russula brevipes]|nr:hypothetical protein BC826DRAFT_1060493 [Russula brevipes]